jgi:hypothetical protein
MAKLLQHIPRTKTGKKKSGLAWMVLKLIILVGTADLSGLTEEIEF